MKKWSFSNSGWSKRLIILLIWLLLWQLLSLLVDNDILLVGPVETAVHLLHLLALPAFYRSLITSGLRILGGILLGSLSGIVLGYASAHLPILGEILSPFVATLRSIPVASFVILVMIWVGGNNISLFISAIIVFPILYQGTVTGCGLADPKLLQMAAVFRMSYGRILRYVELPAALPAVGSALTLGIGMAFKSGVAAEVIAQAAHTLGNELYRSKIYLETGDLLAYTFVIVLCAWLAERSIVLGLSFLIQKGVFHIQASATDALDLSPEDSMHPPAADSMDPPEDWVCKIAPETPNWIDPAGCLIQLSHVSKSYDGRSVLQDVTFSVKAGSRILITGESGSGKTTLLRLLLGLEQPDGGTITFDGSLHADSRSIRAGTVFQENRLCPPYQGLDQLRMVCPKSFDAVCADADLNALLGKDAAAHPVSSYSGGMKRRCAIARAVWFDAPLLIMDEPFSGLDEENRSKVLDYILRRSQGRTLILVAHDGTEAAGLDTFQQIHIENGTCKVV